MAPDLHFDSALGAAPDLTTRKTCAKAYTRQASFIFILIFALNRFLRNRAERAVFSVSRCDFLFNLALPQFQFDLVQQQIIRLRGIFIPHFQMHMKLKILYMGRSSSYKKALISIPVQISTKKGNVCK